MHLGCKSCEEMFANPYDLQLHLTGTPTCETYHESVLLCLVHVKETGHSGIVAWPRIDQPLHPVRHLETQARKDELAVRAHLDSKMNAEHVESHVQSFTDSTTSTFTCSIGHRGVVRAISGFSKHLTTPTDLHDSFAMSNFSRKIFDLPEHLDIMKQKLSPYFGEYVNQYDGRHETLAYARSTTQNA